MKFFAAVQKDFEHRYPHLSYMPVTQDKYFIGGKVCDTSKRQPDQGWRIPLSNGRCRFIDGELDEDCHSSNASSCETLKMTDTNFGVNNGDDEVMFLRVGLDYKHTKKELNEAVTKYVDRLAYWLQNMEPARKLYTDYDAMTGEPLRVGVEYICYNKKGQQHELAAIHCDQVYVYGRY